MSTSERTLLLVDDEENILRSLVRLLRRDGYRLLTANSAAAALEILAQNDVQVIVSDQRMPGMTGTEFFKLVKQSHPETVRIILSGYTDLASVTDAINEGAIFRFLTKPWEDPLLSRYVREAFETFEAGGGQSRVGEGQGGTEETPLRHGAAAGEAPASPPLCRQVLEALPVGVLALDGAGVIALANLRARTLLQKDGVVFPGSAARDVLPREIFERYQSVAQDPVSSRAVLPGFRDGAVDVVVQATDQVAGAVQVLVLFVPRLAGIATDALAPFGTEHTASRPGRGATPDLAARSSKGAAGPKQRQGTGDRDEVAMGHSKGGLKPDATRGARGGGRP